MNKSEIYQFLREIGYDVETVGYFVNAYAKGTKDIVYCIDTLNHDKMNMLTKENIIKDICIYVQKLKRCDDDIVLIIPDDILSGTCSVKKLTDFFTGLTEEDALRISYNEYMFITGMLIQLKEHSAALAKKS